MATGILFLVLCLSALSYVSPMKRYDGYQLISVFPKTKALTEFVQSLSEDVQLDFWYEGHDRFDIFVPPHKIHTFTSDMTARGIELQVVESNMQTVLDMEQQQMLESRIANEGKQMNVDYGNWNTYANIMAELDVLSARCNSAPNGVNCEVINLGNSFEGRAIRGLRIFSGAGRRAIWVDATIHAREWLSTATHLLIMKHIVDDHTDSVVADFLRKYDFYFIPVSNPDGYSFSHTNDRMWRKNRRPNAGSTCVGTDLNRNYDQMWGNAGAATTPCSETYRGTGPGSEPETQLVQGALRQVGASLHFSMHIHTYGNLWLIPWGSVTTTGACNIATDHNWMLPIAHAGANAIQATYGTSWSRGNSCATIYPASGITMDYSKGVGGVAFTVTPELRGGNFVVNVNQIPLSYNEIWNGIVATVRALEAVQG